MRYLPREDLTSPARWGRRKQFATLSVVPSRTYIFVHPTTYILKSEFEAIGGYGGDIGCSKTAICPWLHTGCRGDLYWQLGE